MIDAHLLKKLSQLNLLIVQKDRAFALELKESLKDYCKHIDLAGDGIEGYELFEQNRADVVISDINLPKLNGLEMIDLMKQAIPSLPIIIVSSSSNNQDLSQCINHEVYSYFIKPINMESLQISLLMATKELHNSYIKLSRGFTYIKQSKTLLNSKDEPVPLTKTEKDFLYLLICNIDSVVEYQVIENYVWQEKSMSAEALRMVVKKLRKKTYIHLIKNISSFGYQISKQN